MGGHSILVWGAGAIGGTVGAHLARAGRDVLLVDRAADHVAAMTEHGLAIAGPVTEFTVPVRAATPEEMQGSFETVLLCVKAQDTESAARALLHQVIRTDAVRPGDGGLARGHERYGGQQQHDPDDLCPIGPAHGTRTPV